MLSRAIEADKVTLTKRLQSDDLFVLRIEVEDEVGEGKDLQDDKEDAEEEEKEE